MPRGVYDRKKSKPRNPGTHSKGKSIHLKLFYVKATTVLQLSHDALEDIVAGMQAAPDVAASDAPGMLIGLCAHLREAARLLAERKV